MLNITCMTYFFHLKIMNAIKVMQTRQFCQLLVPRSAPSSTRTARTYADEGSDFLVDVALEDDAQSTSGRVRDFGIRMYVVVSHHYFKEVVFKNTEETT